VDEEVITGTESNNIEGAHPPHIHNIEVQCAKDQMTINLEFNRAFNGVIYSKVSTQTLPVNLDLNLSVNPQPHLLHFLPFLVSSSHIQSHFVLTSCS
jgi:hypothetical protein